MKWTEDMIKDGIMELAQQFDPIRMPSNQETIEMSGSHALAMAIQKTGGYESWAKKLGLEQKYSETRMGLKWERIAAHILRINGFEVEMTSMRYPYDLLVDGCVKVDVKAANASKVKGSDVYAYRISKPQQTCDFYICCENDKAKRMYVIPANAVKGQKQIEMGKFSTKYDHYKDAWYLIKETADFYKSLVVPL